MVKISIVLASGGGFLFTLLVAKYWPATEYGNFVSVFSVVSYLSFPFLYGLVPEVLRRYKTHEAVSLPSIGRVFFGFLSVYAILSILILLVWARELRLFFESFIVFSVVLATGAAELVLRRRSQDVAVFHARAMGMLISLAVIGVIVCGYSGATETSAMSLVARVMPPAIVFLLLCILNISGRNRSNGDLCKSQRGLCPKLTLRCQISAVIDAGIISLTVGIFQYAFLVVGRAMVIPDEFVSVSLELMVGMTACQKIIEPHVFKLYSAKSGVDTLFGGAYKRGFFILFIELILLSIMAQFIVLYLIIGYVDLMPVFAVAFGSALVSMACLGQFAAYVSGASSKYSIVIFMIMFLSLLLVYVLKINFGVNYLFLIMASFYFIAVSRQIKVFSVVKF